MVIARVVVSDQEVVVVDVDHSIVAGDVDLLDADTVEILVPPSSAAYGVDDDEPVGLTIDDDRDVSPVEDRTEAENRAATGDLVELRLPTSIARSIDRDECPTIGDHAQLVTGSVSKGVCGDPGVPPVGDCEVRSGYESAQLAMAQHEDVVDDVVRWCDLAVEVILSRR